MKLYRTPSYGWVVEHEDDYRVLQGAWNATNPELGERVAAPTRLLPPVVPTKIVCVGLNYARHAEEMSKEVPREPLLFMKPTTSLLAPGGTIELPPSSAEVHHEGELAVVVKSHLRRATEGEARAAIFGYTCANDVTARDIQRREQRYTRAKGFDTFCPVGPCVVYADSFDPAEHAIELRVNDEVRQESSLDDFIFGIPRVLSFISEIMTLHPGDIVLTGTPAGVGPMVAGDTVSVEIDGIGTLVNRVG